MWLFYTRDSTTKNTCRITRGIRHFGPADRNEETASPSDSPVRKSGVLGSYVDEVAVVYTRSSERTIVVTVR